MLRATAMGLVSVIALGVCLAAAAPGKGGGGGGGGGGGVMHSSGGGAAVTRGGGGPGISAGSNLTVVRPGPRPGPGMSQHETGTMRMGDRDRDHDRDHDRFHDRFHVRFFPALASGTYYDTYPDYSTCWDVYRVHSPHGWRLRRVWVCDGTY